ncbi:MAG TPA: ribosome biogenesis GTPase Der [Firmicutes bacterium]|jgi:GTP-binding protein|nr:ribosome biogenesis GTPase Der [Bacillota bacterium]
MQQKPVIAIVGRPNVGKSELFNRMAGERISIVENQPGVTRDRIYAECMWLNRPYMLIDTGGILLGDTGDIEAATLYQARLAIEEADIIIFVVDVKDGVTSADREVAQVLRQTQKPVLLVVNKVDNLKLEADSYEFYSLGIGDPITVSATHGRGIGDMLDAAFSHLPEQPAQLEEDERIRVAVIGRPNVGKSSLINSILGRERVIVSNIPGTTRDAIDTDFSRGDTHFTLIDTAGIRRRAKVDEAVEHYSVLRALKAIDRSDVCLVIIDATEGVTEQDARIAGNAHEAGRACVIVVNKWDLVEKDSNTMKAYDARIRQDLRFMQYAPIVYISALTGKRVQDVLDLIEYVAQQHALRVPTGRLNEVIHEAVALREPPHDKGVRLRIMYGAQVSVKPPTIVLFVNRPDLMHFSYERYLENQLRAAFGFVGTPLRIKVRSTRDEGY